MTSSSDSKEVPSMRKENATNRKDRLLEALRAKKRPREERINQHGAYRINW